MSDVWITPLGHASVLLEVGAARILLDPVLNERIGVRIGRWTVGRKRLQPPARTLQELAHVDAVALSHSHMDHTDLHTLSQLPTTAVAIVQRNNADLVRRFSDTRELDWGESTSVVCTGGEEVRFTSVRVRHWGARMVIDRQRGWGGYLIELPHLASQAEPERPVSIFFAGDTAFTDSLRDLRKLRDGYGVDLAIMPIGAYRPWIWNHCTPEQAWTMAMEHLGAHALMPIHFDTFRLSAEPRNEPLLRLLRVAKRANLLGRVVGSGLGDRVAVHDLGPLQQS